MLCAAQHNTQRITVRSRSGLAHSLAQVRRHSARFGARVRARRVCVRGCSPVRTNCSHRIHCCVRWLNPSQPYLQVAPSGHTSPSSPNLGSFESNNTPSIVASKHCGRANSRSAHVRASGGGRGWRVHVRVRGGNYSCQRETGEGGRRGVP
jgi:hypothetical protein